MLKDFDKFMSQLKETNQTLDFFCDFEKISQNVEDIKLSLCMLNSLIGASDLRKSIETIWNRDKNAFSVMDILVAVRTRDKKKILDSVGNCVPLEGMFNSVDSVMAFLTETGLGDVLQSQKIKNLVDYVFGIETGLDTNARKNRSGHVMENMVANILTNAGVPFRQEVYSREWSAITDVLGDDEKRFDFVVETPSKVYLIEKMECSYLEDVVLISDKNTQSGYVTTTAGVFKKAGAVGQEDLRLRGDLVVGKANELVVILGILPQTAQRHRHAPLQHPVQTGLGAVRFLKIVEKLLGGGG